MSGWAERAAALVAELTATGRLTDPRWAAAFAEVPRHVFVPRFHRDGVLVDGGDPRQRDEWLAAVYSDTALVTQQAPVPGTDLVWPTSSSSAPWLMARMLELLEVAEDDSVLEIGTGTGYNAGLLCHRLGESRVTSVDIDPELVDAARERLAAIGYRPLLVTADGTGGVPAAAPYRRIIATAAVPAAPVEWVRQLATGGVIVADIRGEVAGGLVVLRKQDADTAAGRFHGTTGQFMWLRPQADNPLRTGGTVVTSWSADVLRRYDTALPPDLLDATGLRFVVQQLIPELTSMRRVDRAGSSLLQLRTADGSWAEADPGSEHRPVREGGTRPIWPAVERAAEIWLAGGRPDISRFGATARSDGTWQVWLDDPAEPVR